MTDKGAKGIRNTGKMKRERYARWFSLDSLIGKALCILLVIILTVGAFLAPKLINNLYDAGTLMQITYVDMKLSPYAVSYADFEDKLQAIARANTAGDHFMTLTAEEREDKISDADLAEAVSREMGLASEGMRVLFYEGWWGDLTEENLISREKNTLYMQPQGNRTDGDSYQETAPIQFWTLTFELTEHQMEEALGGKFGNLSDLSEEEKRIIEEEKKIAMKSIYTTDKLMVCLDTDFYKIYAVAVEGDGEKISDMYGWYLPELFRTVPEGTRADAAIEEMYGFSEYTDLQMFMTDQIVEGFVKYWDVTPEDKNIYKDIPGELTGCVAFPGDTVETEGAEDAQQADKLFKKEDFEVVGADGTVIKQFSTDTFDERNSETVNEILLEVGCQGKFDEVNALWIQKAGCRHFFDMMQF